MKTIILMVSLVSSVACGEGQAIEAPHQDHPNGQFGLIVNGQFVQYPAEVIIMSACWRLSNTGVYVIEFFAHNRSEGTADFATKVNGVIVRYDKIPPTINVPIAVTLRAPPPPYVLSVETDQSSAGGLPDIETDRVSDVPQCSARQGTR